MRGNGLVLRPYLRQSEVHQHMRQLKCLPGGRSDGTTVENYIVLNGDQLQTLIRATVADTLRQLSLDNLTADRVMSKGEEDMALIRRRIVIGYNDDGTEIVKRIQAKDENEANDRTVQAYIDSGRIWEFMEQRTSQEPQKNTQTQFKAYAEMWMKTFKLPKLKPKTYQSYVGYLHTHLYPAFGERFIEEITTQDVQQFMNDRAHLARKSLKSYHDLLAQILDAAVEDKIIAENPAKSKRLANPSTKEKERMAVPEAQFREITKNVMNLENSAEKLMLALLIFTGMRRGEVLGLRWDDINFDEKCIHIRRNVTHPGNPPVIGTPKTKSGIRDVYFGENLEAILLAMRGEGFVFGGESPLSRKEYLTLEGHIRKKVDLHGATPHVFRHTYLTTAAGENIDPKTLQSMAGHADHQVTMNVYVHPKKENVAKAGQMMDALLGSYADAS